MNKDKVALVKNGAEKLLADLGVAGEVLVEEVENGPITVQIETSESSLLIGFHGEMLQAFQLILAFLIHRQLGEWVSLSVNVGDYRQKREDQLKKLALNLAMKAKFSGEPQAIPNLLPSERRLIHLFLTDHPDVKTESEGEGRQRQLVIKPKPKI